MDDNPTEVRVRDKASDEETLHHSVSVLLTQLQESHHDPTDAKTEEIWTSIEYLINAQQPQALKNGLALWVRWLALPQYVCFKRENYWSLLHGCFSRSHGNSTLQKFCVHILRQSILILDIDVDDAYMSFKVGQNAQYIDAYSKYCSFFETIIIGRYMNQVEECLAQFPAFSGYLEPFEKIDEKTSRTLMTNAKSNAAQHGVSLVKCPWWILLFSAGLQQQNSELIRKAIGTYLLANYHPPHHSPNLQTESNRELQREFSQFLSDSFLPWAVQGQLLNKHLRRRGHEVWTDHGDQLASFCTALAITDRENVRTILHYLTKFENKRSGHAIGYILQAVSLSDTWEPDLEIAELALQLPETIQLSHRQRTIVLNQCLTIARRFASGTIVDLEGVKYSKSTESLERRQQRLADIVEVETRPFLGSSNGSGLASKTAVKIFDPSILSLEDFEAQTKGENGPQYVPCPHTPGACIHGRSLLGACEYLVQVFDSATQHEEDLVMTILHRIFFEFERQEHPSTLAGVLPQLILHPRLVRACVTNVEIKASIGKYIHNIYEICRGNIYFWEPLAQAIRKAYIHCPGILQLLHIEDIFFAFVNDPPAPRPEFLLDSALAKRERELFHNPLTIYADESCGHACVFDILNRLRPEDKEWAANLAERLLRRWLNQREPVSVVSPWKKTSQLQALFFLFETCTPVTDDSGPEKQVLHILTILRIISIEPLPRYRFLLEWIVTSAATNTPRNIAITECLLDLMEYADPANPKLVTSLIKMTTQLVMNGIPDVQSDTKSGSYIPALPNYIWSPDFETRVTQKLSTFIPMETAPELARSIRERLFDITAVQSSESSTLRLLSILNSFIASSKINIKHESMWSFANLYTHSLSQGYQSITSNPAFRAMFNFFQRLEKYKNPPEGRIFEEFDIRKDRSLGTLFEGGYLRVDPVEVALVTVKDFEGLAAEDGRLPEGTLPLGTSLSLPKKTNEAPMLHAEIAESTMELPKHVKSTPLQTKSYNLPQTLAPLTTTPIDLIPPAATAGNGPILIGSLLEIPHNLGGLSRVAEIFGCSALHIPSLTVLKNGQFKNVAVNSETHITVEETPISSLVNFLRSKKTEGYKIIGVEQTDESVVLGAGEEQDKSMTEKCVIIMGAERTGIPADVLVECDFCVEIKQWGVTRSLNVQTAAAVVLYEWRRLWS